MRVLGLDPSLTNFGYAVHETDGVGKERCSKRGRFRTLASTLYVQRYMHMRTELRALIRDVRPDHMGIEFPVFGNLYSEGMYGLFLFCSEAIFEEHQDVVFWSPGQIKAHARDLLKRPPKWVMMKPDMVEAAKKDTGGGVWNHNEADAYHAARLSARFWQFHGGEIHAEDLTTLERRLFLEVKQYTKGKKAGKEVQKGVLYREDERFFRFSTNGVDDDGNGKNEGKEGEGGPSSQDR